STIPKFCWRTNPLRLSTAICAIDLSSCCWHCAGSRAAPWYSSATTATSPITFPRWWRWIPSIRHGIPIMFFKLARSSLFNRRGTVFLTVLSITISVLVLLAVDHIRYEARRHFQQTVSGVDLIVGARTGQLNLLL